MDDSTKQLKTRRGMHPNSLKNLEKRKSWKPGQQGRHKGMTITQRQQQMMSEACPFDGKGRTWGEALAEGGLRQALNTPVALSNLQDRHEGKVTQPVSGELNHNVSFVIGKGYIKDGNGD